MKKNILFVTVIMLVSWYNPLKGQNCEKCKTRKLIVYDNDVQVLPTDSTSYTSMTNFLKLYTLAEGFYDYFKNTESTKDCYFTWHMIYGFIDTMTIKSNLSVLSEAIRPPTGSESADYIINCSVAGSNGAFTVNMNLETAISNEVVQTIIGPYDYSEDPMVRGRNIASSMAPLYLFMMSFEEKKRDQGDPWAIFPKVVLTPDKTLLNENESTNVKIVLTDCDGTLLKNRKLDLDVEGGTLDNTSVTTDENGEATVKFTAGSSPGVALMNATYSYKHPTGKIDVTDDTPISFQIQKPNDSWRIMAALRQTNHDLQTSKSQYYWSNYEQTEKEGITLFSNLKNTLPVTSSLPNQFMIDTILSNPRGSTYDNMTMWGSYHDEFLCAYNDTEDQLNCNTNKGAIISQEIAIAIDSNGYDISFFNIQASSLGGEDEKVKTSNCTESKSTDTHLDECSGSKTFDLKVKNISKDTSYSTKVDTTMMGVHHTIIHNITQTCSWDTKEFNLKYTDIFKETTDHAGHILDYDLQENTTEALITLWYIGDMPTNIRTFKQNSTDDFLIQNQPNPFSDNTKIMYHLPETTNLKLSVYDIYGKEVMVLDNGLKTKGIYGVILNADLLSSGIYYYRLETNNFVASRKMIILKK